MSANHNGSFETAKRIITEARVRGADAVKVQTYRPDTITLESDFEEFCIRGGLWDGKTLHDLYAEAHMPWEWHEPLFEHAREEGITIFSSPFDDTAVELLEKLNAPAYKIASFEIVDLSLIRRVARSGKPVILSTGMADAEEIGEAVEAARSAGCEELALLHCVSGYPAPAADYNLQTLVDMAERFGCVVGLSDHTLDNTTAVASIALGAALVEKHFTLDHGGGGPDDSFSLEPDGLGELCRGVRTAWEALGEVDYGRKSSEQGNVQFRRSLYAVQAISAGEPFSRENVRSIRPGFGLHPKYLDVLLGRTAHRSYVRGEPIEQSELPPEI
jgi:N-acetylneuraminate synthase